MTVTHDVQSPLRLLPMHRAMLYFDKHQTCKNTIVLLPGHAASACCWRATDRFVETRSCYAVEHTIRAGHVRKGGVSDPADCATYLVCHLLESVASPHQHPMLSVLGKHLHRHKTTALSSQVMSSQTRQT